MFAIVKKVIVIRSSLQALYEFRSVSTWCVGGLQNDYCLVFTNKRILSLLSCAWLPASFKRRNNHDYAYIFHFKLPKYECWRSSQAGCQTNVTARDLYPCLERFVVCSESNM